MTIETPDGRTLTEWRRIPEFPKYQITPDGDIRNIRTGRLLAETENKKTGAFYYTLGKLMPDGRYISTTRNYKSLVKSAYPEGQLMTITNIAPRIEARDGIAVAVYTKHGCFGCDKTKAKLDENAIDYTAVNVEEDEAAFTYVTETLGYRQMPVVVVSTPDGDVVWSGLQPAMIREHITHREMAA